MSRVALHRLATGELVNFWAERETTPMHIALAGVLAPGSLVDERGELRIDEVRERVALRLERAPQLKQRVLWTHLGEGPPAWIEDAAFDITAHVDVADNLVADVGAGAAGHVSEPQFFAWCASEATRKLDRDRPLWRMRFAPHVDGERVGVLVVLHHAVADGLRGVALIGSLLDVTRADRATAPPPSTLPARSPNAAHAPHAERAPGAWQLVVDNVTSRVRSWASVVRALPGALRAAPARIRMTRALFAQMRGKVAETPLEHPIAKTRRFFVIERSLDAVHGSAHELGVSLNDVVLGAVAGGLREWLAALSVVVRGPLRVSVPLGAATGNEGGVMLVPLPVDEADAAARLARISAFTRDAKARFARRAGASWDLPWAPLWLSHLWVLWMRRFGRRRVNAYVTNVPGPPEHLWLGDAELARAVPIAPLVAGVALSVAVFSYGSALSIAVHVDGEVPAPERLVDGIARALDDSVARALDASVDASRSPSSIKA